MAVSTSSFVGFVDGGRESRVWSSRRFGLSLIRFLSWIVAKRSIHLITAKSGARSIKLCSSEGIVDLCFVYQPR